MINAIPTILVVSHLGPGRTNPDVGARRAAQRYLCRFVDGGTLDIDGPELERLHREGLATVVWSG